jgi:hypothetical protein
VSGSELGYSAKDVAEPTPTTGDRIVALGTRQAWQLLSLSKPLKSRPGVFLLKMSVVSLNHRDTRAAYLGDREQVQPVRYQIRNRGVP